MKRYNLRISTLLVTAVLFSGLSGLSYNLQAQSIKPVTVQSSGNYDETISAIKKAVSGNGMMVLSEMDSPIRKTLIKPGEFIICKKICYR